MRHPYVTTYVVYTFRRPILRVLTLLALWFGFVALLMAIARNGVTP